MSAQLAAPLVPFFLAVLMSSSSAHAGEAIPSSTNDREGVRDAVQVTGTSSNAVRNVTTIGIEADRAISRFIPKFDQDGVPGNPYPYPRHDVGSVPGSRTLESVGRGGTVAGAAAGAVGCVLGAGANESSLERSSTCALATGAVAESAAVGTKMLAKEALEHGLNRLGAVGAAAGSGLKAIDSGHKAMRHYRSGEYGMAVLSGIEAAGEASYGVSVGFLSNAAPPVAAGLDLGRMVLEPLADSAREALWNKYWQPEEDSMIAELTSPAAIARASAQRRAMFEEMSDRNQAARVARRNEELQREREAVEKAQETARAEAERIERRASSEAFNRQLQQVLQFQIQQPQFFPEVRSPSPRSAPPVYSPSKGFIINEDPNAKSPRRDIRIERDPCPHLRGGNTTC